MVVHNSNILPHHGDAKIKKWFIINNLIEISSEKFRKVSPPGPLQNFFGTSGAAIIDFTHFFFGVQDPHSDGKVTDRAQQNIRETCLRRSQPSRLG